MKLRFYDILSHLIPGLMIYFSIMFLWEIPQHWQQFLPAFAFSMAIGFFVNALSSWLEPIFYWTWGGKPSNQLLNGKELLRLGSMKKKKLKTYCKIIILKKGREVYFK